MVTKDEADELAAAAAEEEEQADEAQEDAAEEAGVDGVAQEGDGVGRTRRRHRPTLVAGQVVCDQMRSGKKTEFVIELVESGKGKGRGGRGKRSSSSSSSNGGVDGEEEDAVDAGSGGGGDASGSGNWPSGDDRHDGGRGSGDDWPGKRGKDGKPVHVEVRLRAPGNKMRWVWAKEGC